MTLYIAAPFKRKKEATEVMNRLAKLGVECTSRWLTNHPDTDDPKELAQQAMDDLEDVKRADCFMLLNYKGWVLEGQGGKHVETGYAIARNKPVYIVGKRWNVFHYLPQIHMLVAPEDIIVRKSQRVGDEVV